MVFLWNYYFLNFFLFTDFYNENIIITFSWKNLSVWFFTIIFYHSNLVNDTHCLPYKSYTEHTCNLYLIFVSNERLAPNPINQRQLSNACWPILAFRCLTTGWLHIHFGINRIFDCLYELRFKFKEAHFYLYQILIRLILGIFVNMVHLVLTIIWTLSR